MKLDEKYIQKYTEDLEHKVLQHIASELERDEQTQSIKYKKDSRWSLRKAHEYMTNIVETLFGTEKHSGLVQFLMEDQQHLNLDLAAAVSRGESLVARGWSVKEKSGRYFLLDDSFATVKDVTGPTDISPVETTLDDFGPDALYNFLQEVDLKSLLSLASAKSIPLENVKSPEFTYDMVMKYEGTQGKLFPIAQTYKGLGEIARKTLYFEADGEEYENLYELHVQGYRVKPLVNPSAYTKTFLSLGNKVFALVPVSGEYIQNESVDLISYRFYQHLYKEFSETGVELPIPVGELDQVYAFLIERQSDLINNQDYGEVVRLLKSMKAQNKQNTYALYDKVLRNIVQMYLIHLLGVGNTGFSAALIGLDHVQPKTYLRFSLLSNLADTKTLERFFLNAPNRKATEKDVLDVLLKGVNLEGVLLDNFSLFLPYVDKEFIAAVQGFKGSKLLEARLSRFADFLKEMV